MRPDTQLQNDVIEELKWSRVTLTGHASSDTEHYEAEATKRVCGVTAVVNDGWIRR